YHRGTTLVRPIIAEVDATHGRRTKVAQLVVIRQPYMIDLLCKSAEWTRYDRRQKKWVRINPPDDIARIILDRCGEWKFDPVIGVITTPTLRPDGSLLAQPGYDPTTWMVLMEPPLIPAISAQPSRDEAIAALNLLDGLLEEFPFVDEASRSVAVSSLEPISKSPEEDNEASELYEAEEVVGVVFPTDEDAALPLNPSKEALHEPTSHIAA